MRLLEIVNSLLFDVLGLRFTLNPQLCLLNIPEGQIPRATMKLLIHILTAARCLIALFWKRTTPPSLIDLLTRIQEVRLMEYMTALSNNQADIFYKVWMLWDVYAAEHDL